MIKCRTKTLAKKYTKTINENNIYCEYDGYYNVYAFKTSKEKDKGYELLNKLFGCEN